MHKYADFTLVILVIAVVVPLVVLVVIMIAEWCCQYKCRKEKHSEHDFITQRKHVARTATLKAHLFLFFFFVLWIHWKQQTSKRTSWISWSNIDATSYRPWERKKVSFVQFRKMFLPVKLIYQKLLGKYR